MFSYLPTITLAVLFILSPAVGQESNDTTAVDGAPTKADLIMLIENYAGKLPFWITPLQTVVIPVSSDFDDYAKNVYQHLKRAGISSEVDLKNHNLNYKIRDHSLTKVPLLLICGKKEVDTNTVTIRRLDSNKQENMELKEFPKKYSALNKAPSI